jgi:hypothetical protein
MHLSLVAAAPALQNVRYWPKADMPHSSSNVRFRGKADIALTRANVR